MSSLSALEKFKAMDTSSTVAKGKISSTKKLISDLSSKLSSSSDKKKNTVVNKESQISASESRRAQREAKIAEDDKKYSGMKPVQAMFNKSIAARSSEGKSDNKPSVIISSSVSVSDIKDKVRRKSIISGNCSRNSVDLDFIPDLPVQSVMDVYTKGNCKTLKDKFETDIQLKKGLSTNGNLESVSKPVARQKTNSDLPDMFEQQKKRDVSASLNKVKDIGIINKESIVGYLDKFESSDSRKQTREKIIELTKKQKNISTPKWSERKSEESVVAFTPNSSATHEKSITQKKSEEVIEPPTEDYRPKKDKDPLTSKKEPTDVDIRIPNIQSSTFADMKRKLKEKTSDDSSRTSKVYKPIRKLSLNQFEEYSSKNSSTSVKSPSIIFNAPKLSDIKKRFVSEKSDAPTSYLAFKSKKVKVEPSQEVKKNTNDMSVKSAIDKIDLAKPFEAEDPQGKAETESISTHDNNENKRSSKSQMQNYLLSKVLFDDKNTNSTVCKEEDNSLEIELMDDTPVDIMSDPYFQEIEKYLSLIGGSDDTKKTTTTKKKKSTDPKKPKKKNLKLKVVELDDIKNKFETKKDPGSKVTSPNGISSMLLEKKVNKFKEKFESSMYKEKEVKDPKTESVVKRRSGVISSDLLCKFDSPEELQKLKKQREEEREARRISRLQKLEEEQRRLEEEARIEKERLEAERLENERVQEQERERLAEEARIAAACEEMMQKEKEKAEARRQQEEAIKSRREKNEPALKKKKVLGRIQHIFDKNKTSDTAPSSVQKPIGSIKDKADELFQPKVESASDKTPFQDSSLAGMSVNRFKDKFETELSKQDEPIHLYSKSEKKKRVPLQTAIDFDNLCQEQPDTAKTPSQNGSEWSWKKKDQGQLAVETTMALIKTNPNNTVSEKKSRSSGRVQRSSESTDQLLKELQSVSERLSKKDAIQEHEMKMKEYEEFIDEIQSFLNEPIQDISDCLDEVRREKKSKKSKSAKKDDKALKGKGDKFNELLKFIKSNDPFVPQSMRSKIRFGMDYKAFLEVIDSFLSAPDRSVEEIEFKDRIESFLDAIDEINSQRASMDAPDIAASCVLNKGSSLLPDVVEGGLRPRRRSLIDDNSIKKSSSVADFQNELSKYRSLLDPKEQDSKWKIGKVDTSFLQKSEEDEKNLDGKRVGPPSALAKEIQNKLVASMDASTSKGVMPARTDKKKKIIVDSFVPKSDEVVRGMRDLKQFIYKNRTELPIEVLDFDCSDKELLSKVRTFTFSEEEKPLKEEIKIYLQLATGPTNPLPTDSIKTDHVADMKKKIFESGSNDEVNLYSAPRRKLSTLETSSSAKDIPLRKKSIDLSKLEWPRNASVRSVNPTPSPPVNRALSKSTSETTVFRNVSTVKKSVVYTDPKEREAAILAKYGVKPRPTLPDSDSSSSSESDSEEEEDIKKLISQDPRLQSIYGDRLLSTEDIPKKSSRSQTDSLSSLRNILGTIRQPQSGPKSSSSAQNIRTVFESTKSKEEPRPKAKIQKSTSFANIKNFATASMDADEDEDDDEARPSWQCAPSGLSRSSSFHRFKSAIEKSDDQGSSSSNLQVQAELDAIRSCSRLQKMFAINKPSGGVSRSRSNSTIESPEVVSDISQARENIRSAFESNHAKVSYGVKLVNDKPKTTPKPQAQSNEAGKKWVYDTINKYFDVIVEDNESDEEDEEDSSSTEVDQDSSSSSTTTCDDESELEIKDFSTIISSRNNQTLKRTKSSAKLRSMISSVMVEKSISVDSMNTFKSNLSSHLRKSQSNILKLENK